MWLLPYLSTVSATAVRVYYRASRGGELVPATGPVLLVANHPNSLLDPAFLSWAAERPVRFLAKAPLFSDPLVGWLVRGSGSIPVYRVKDDPALSAKNDDTFRAVHAALNAGAAVSLFPEGVSHSAPALAPIKTGAARIALGAMATIGHPFPIIPVGLFFRAKDRFRSEAHAVVGTPVSWDDLAGRTEDDRDAVRELTARIERGMRQVTLNLARWEDEPVVRTAEAVWAATHDPDPLPGARAARVARTADILARFRATADVRWEVLAQDVRDHARTLRVLGMRPSDLQMDTGVTTAARWALRRLTVVAGVQAVIAAVAIVLFWIPYRLTGLIASRMTKDKDTVSTYRVLGGALLFGVWIIALAVAGAAWRGRAFGIAALVALPLVAFAGVRAFEAAQWSVRVVRRWLIVWRGDPRIAELRTRQIDLSRRLDDALAASELVP